MRAVLYVLGGLAIITFFVIRQRRSDRYRERSLILPLALGSTGLPCRMAVAARSAHRRLDRAARAERVGVCRVRCVSRQDDNLFVRDGELWEQASWRTIGVGWGGLLVTRMALIGIAGLLGAQFAASPTSIPLMIAITLAAQMLLVAERARAFGVPIAGPRRRGRRRRAV